MAWCILHSAIGIFCCLFVVKMHNAHNRGTNVASESIIRHSSSRDNEYHFWVLCVYYMLCVWLQVSVVSWAICEQPGHLQTHASRQRTAHISEYLSFVVFDRSLEPAETRLGKMVYYIRVLAD